MKLQVLGTVVLALWLCPAFPSPCPRSTAGHQGGVLAHLSVRHVSGGATAFARVTVDWSGKNCFLKQGSILEARVESAVPRKGSDHSELALAFTKAQCNGADLTPIELVLAAVAAVPNEWASAPDSRFGMPMSFSNPNGNGMPGFGASRRWRCLHDAPGIPRESTTDFR